MASAPRFTLTYRVFIDVGTTWFIMNFRFLGVCVQVNLCSYNPDDFRRFGSFIGAILLHSVKSVSLLK